MVVREFILLVTKLDTSLLILVLAIMDLSDQELCDALDEFERTIFYAELMEGDSLP